MQQDDQSAASESSDFPPKRLVRQLDFAAARYRGASPPAVASVALEQPPEEPLKQHSPLLPMSSPLPICRPSIPLPMFLLVHCIASVLHLGYTAMGATVCTNCCNNAARHDAVEAILERNPNAFRTKIGGSPYVT
ncbi:hypothetical protein BHM03_00001323 [Ensete ventricosum]|nr:hypothetical protein BHM03_00001323 [Ensete ventricosum]